MDSLLPQKLLVVYVPVCLLACQVLRVTLSLWQLLLSSCTCVPLQVWCVKTHILQLLSAEENLKLNSLTNDLHSEPAR